MMMMMMMISVRETVYGLYFLGIIYMLFDQVEKEGSDPRCLITHPKQSAVLAGCIPMHMYEGRVRKQKTALLSIAVEWIYWEG